MNAQIVVAAFVGGVVIAGLLAIWLLGAPPELERSLPAKVDRPVSASVPGTGVRHEAGAPIGLPEQTDNDDADQNSRTQAPPEIDSENDIIPPSEEGSEGDGDPAAAGALPASSAGAASR